MTRIRRTLRRLRVPAVLAGLAAVLALGPVSGASATPRDTDTPYTWPGAAILTVGTEPDGGGFVQSAPYLIDCPFACVRSVAPGTVLELTATPSQGFEFTDWTGPCAGQGNPCTATIGASAAVTALFTYDGIPEQDFGRRPSGAGGPYTLTVQINHSPTTSDRSADTVTDGSGALNCPAVNCSAQYPAGSTVFLFVFAYPDNAYFPFPFGTTGCDFNFGDSPPYGTSCGVVMTSDRTITATFTAPNPPWPGP